MPCRPRRRWMAAGSAGSTRCASTSRRTLLRQRERLLGRAHRPGATGRAGAWIRLPERAGGHRDAGPAAAAAAEEAAPGAGPRAHRSRLHGPGRGGCLARRSRRAGDRHVPVLDRADRPRRTRGLPGRPGRPGNRSDNYGFLCRRGELGAGQTSPPRAAMQSQSPSLASPFLSPRVHDRRSSLRQGGTVAVLTVEGPEFVRFFPFERGSARGRLPIAAGLNRAASLIPTLPASIDARELVDDAGSRRHILITLRLREQPFETYRTA